MKWLLPLTVSWMNFATQLASWMLWLHDRGLWVGLLQPTVRVLSKNGSIVRTSPVVIPSLWPPLVLPLMNMQKRSTTWCLLMNINPMLETSGFHGEENGVERVIWCTLNFQEPARGPKNEEKIWLQS